MELKYFIFLLTCSFVLQPVFSQIDESEKNDTLKSGFAKISEKVDSKSGEVIFHQDKRIESMMVENVSTSAAFANGFRVQVFSSNAHSAAKDQAFKLEQTLNENFPDYKVYVTYSSPFWKVRIGDFLTQQDARAFSDELVKKIPNLRKETYTVKDRVVVSDKKD